MEQILQESYKKSAKEDAVLVKDWGAAVGDGIAFDNLGIHIIIATLLTRTKEL